MSQRPQDAAAQGALDGAVNAFLDLDNRQTYAADALAALDELGDGPDPDGAARAGHAALRRDWSAVAKTCLDASGHYLSVSSQYSLTDSLGRPTRVDPAAAQAAFGQVHRELADAAAAVDRFFSQHRRVLEDALAQRASAPLLATQARAAAAKAEQALTAAENDGVAYTSVLNAADGLIAAITALNSAGEKPGPTRTAAAAVQREATNIADKIATARALAPTLRATSTSVRTRIEAVASRLGGLPATRSALLREFASASSADLVDADDKARREWQDAKSDFDAAGPLISTDPEKAHDLFSAARAHLATAEAQAGALTDRLRRLRETRDDPQAAAKPIRFRLRDAQLLVVGRGLVPQWGSVLDAQLARIDRAAADLTGAHPDYWAYLSTLSAVETFVRGIVDRVRTDAR